MAQISRGSGGAEGAGGAGALSRNIPERRLPLAFVINRSDGRLPNPFLCYIFICGARPRHRSRIKLSAETPPVCMPRIILPSEIINHLFEWLIAETWKIFSSYLRLPILTKHTGRQTPIRGSDLFILSKQYRESRSRQRSENTQTVSSKSLSKLVNIETEVGSETSAAAGRSGALGAGARAGVLIVSSGTRQTRRSQTHDSSKIFILCIEPLRLTCDLISTLSRIYNRLFWLDVGFMISY